MLIKFICCDVFTRIACHIISNSPNIVDVEFLPMLAHNEPTKLKTELQKRIDAACILKNYDAVVLGYGLCGNATAGLTCKTKLIIPRIHDCCTMFMGSKEKFVQTFNGAYSTRWATSGYYERCYINSMDTDYMQRDNYKTSKEYMDLLEQYGDENADYIWETMHPIIETDEAIYIRIDSFEHFNSMENYKNSVEELGKKVRVVDGNIDFLSKLINGPWDNSIFLTVMPSETIVPVYDMDTVMSAN